MRVFILSAVAAVILALAWGYGLNTAVQQSIAGAYVGDSVRLDQQEAVNIYGREG